MLVIASKATLSKFKNSGLLRRYAPRNDAVPLRSRHTRVTPHTNTKIQVVFIFNFS